GAGPSFRRVTNAEATRVSLASYTAAATGSETTCSIPASSTNQISLRRVSFCIFSATTVAASNVGWVAALRDKSGPSARGLEHGIPLVGSASRRSQHFTFG